MANEQRTVDTRGEHDDLVGALAALAHPLRMQVVRALVAAGPQGLTPGTVQAALTVPAATLSFHLKGLADAGLVTQARSGRFLVYRAASERIDGLLDAQQANFRSGAAMADPQPDPGPA